MALIIINAMIYKMVEKERKGTMMNCFIEKLKQTKELQLSDWGPYSKHYAGISKVLNDSRRSMVDFNFLLGYVRGKTIIPDVNFESGYHHWEANTDLNYFSYRYELQWKDIEYADVEFFRNQKGILSKITFHNETEYDKEYFCAPFSVLRTQNKVTLNLLDNETWIGAESYAEFQYKNPKVEWVEGKDYESLCHTKQLSIGKDGLIQGELIQDYFVGGKGIGNQSKTLKRKTVDDNKTFLMNPGSEIRYEVISKIKTRFVYIRYAMHNVKNIQLNVIINEKNQKVNLTKQTQLPIYKFDDLEMIQIELNDYEKINSIKIQVIDIAVEEEPSFVFDGILVSNEPEVKSVMKRFQIDQQKPRFKINRKISDKGLLLESNIIKNLRIALFSDQERPRPPKPYSDSTVTQIFHSELSGSEILRKISNDALLNWYTENSIFYGDEENHFVSYNIAPIVCPAHSKREIYLAMVCETNDQMSDQDMYSLGKEMYENRYEIERKTKNQFIENDNSTTDTSFFFSQEKLRVQILTNLTYPVYISTDYFKTYTPGKRWGGLYTWDSGMHAIGLVEYDIEKATQIVNQYMMDTSNKNVPAVVHGSPLPLHIYVLNEIYHKTGDKELLEFFYPRAVQYYDYFTGQHPMSKYDSFKSGLLNSYYDGYNTIGIDDYPAQHYEGEQGLYGDVSIVSASAHGICIGDIMIKFATILGKEEDISRYQKWNSYLGKALQKYSWDQESGYYAHILNENKKKILYENTINYNMGIDGVSPILTNICRSEQKERLKNHIMTEGEMWTPYGITAVAMNAPYSRPDGYWNGKVWIPHQWFIWKAFINHGYLEEARKIAFTALETWKRNVEETYNTYEQFDGCTGMGEGCHQFAGLSAPLAAFYHAYFSPGQLTVGYQVLVHNYSYNHEKKEHVIELSSPSEYGETGVLLALNKKGTYEIITEEKTKKYKVDENWIQFKIKLGRSSKKIKIKLCDKE